MKQFRLTYLRTSIGGPPTHSHPSDEGLYILEGHGTFHAGGETVQAGPGTLVSVPRFVEHSFTVDAPHSRLLNFYSPGGFEMLLMSLATPAAERTSLECGYTSRNNLLHKGQEYFSLGVMLRRVG